MCMCVTRRRSIQYGIGCVCMCVCVLGGLIIRFSKSKALSKGPSSQNHFQNTKNIICLFHCTGTHWDSLTGIA